MENLSSEQKDLLLRDISSRLPYGVELLCDMDRTFEGGFIAKLVGIDMRLGYVIVKGSLTPYRFDEFRPYLRPMNSMTDEEVIQFFSIRGKNPSKEEINRFRNSEVSIVSLLSDYGKKMRWLNERMFDYNNLIPLGLALPALEDMYENKNL